MSPALHEKKTHLFAGAILSSSLIFFQFISVKLCRVHGDLAQVNSSASGAYTIDPSAANCSCHSE